MVSSPDINLDTPVEQPTISIDDGVNTSPNLSPSQVDDRSTRTHFALSNTLPNKTFEDVHQDISTGKENKLRAEAASTVDSKKAQDVKNVVSDALLKGLPIGVEDLSSIVKYSQQQTNPDTVVEDRYGAQHMRFLNWPMHEADTPHPLKDAIVSDPEHTEYVSKLGRSLIAKNADVDHLIEDAEALVHNQSNLGFGVDFAKSLIPFYGQVKMGEFGLTGSALEKEGTDLYSIPDLDEFHNTIKTKYDSIAKDNPQLALQWLRAIRGQSSGEKILNNVGTIFDTATVATPVARVLGLRNLVTNTTRGIVKATEAAAEQTPAVAASAAAGDLAGAGRLKATATITHIVTDKGNPVEDTMQQWPSILKKTADDIGKNAGNFGQEEANRLVQLYNEKTSKLQEGLANTVHVETNNFVPTPENMKALETEMKERYKFENTLNIGEPIFNETTKTNDVPIHLGTSSADYFRSAEDAKRWAETKGLLDHEIVPVNGDQGVVGARASEANSLRKTIDSQARELTAIARAGKDENLPQSLLDRKEKMLASFKENVEKLKGITENGGPVYIRIMRPFPKNASFIKDLISTTKDTEIQNSWLNAVVGWARTPEETQSLREMQNRKVIEYAPSIVKQFYKEVATPLRTVMKGRNGKEALQAFERIVDHVEKTGEWFKDPLELEGMYQKFFGRLPSHAETEAHFAYKYARQVEQSLRQNMAYRAAHDKGAVSLRLFQLHADGRKEYSPYFNAIRRADLPEGSGGIYVAGDRIGEDHVFNKGVCH